MMNIYKKHTSIVVIIILLLSSISFVYADIQTPASTPSTNTQTSCEACFNTSPYIDKYIDFADAIIKTMLTYANKETSILATPQNANLSTQASTQTQTDSDFARQLGSIADNLNKKAQTAASAGYVASLITAESVLLDSWKSIGPMFQSQAIMRDWTKLDTVGQKIMNTFLDLGNSGIFIRLGFKEGFQERINSIIMQYSTGNEAILKSNSSLSYGGSDILTALWEMNQGLKTYIGAGNIAGRLDATYLKSQLQFSSEMRESLIGEYSIDGEVIKNGYYNCAHGLQGFGSCSTLGTQAKENSKAIRADTKKETKNAKKIITDSLKRLQTFLAKNGGVQNRTQKQDDYLRSIYGIQGIRNNLGESLVKGFRESRKTIKDDINSQFSKKPKKSGGGDSLSIGDIATQIDIQDNKSAIEDSIKDTISLAQNERTTSQFASVEPVTQVLPLLTQEVVNSAYKIDGNKSNAITKNLGKACDAQCKNVGGKCRYY